MNTIIIVQTWCKKCKQIHARHYELQGCLAKSKGTKKYKIKTQKKA